jgi:F0F1-type ATP synthase membrane subunit b/b'
MRRIIAVTLALTVLSSTWLLGAEGATKAKKAVKKPAPPPASAQMQKMQDQLNQQQQQINQLQGQLQQSNQQLQSTQTQLQSSVTKANQDAAAAQQAASAAQQTANSLNSSVVELKACCTDLNASVTALKKDVNELMNPLAIRYKKMTMTPIGYFEGSAFWRQRAQGGTATTNYAGTALYGTAATGISEFRMTAQNTQIGFLYQGDAGKAKLTGLWQIDLNGPVNSGTAAGVSGAGTPAIVNSNNFYPRLRHAWARAEVGNGWAFTAGQTWFLGMMNRKLITQLTEWYPVGDDNQTFPGFSQPNRPTQFRLTKNFANNKAAFAIDMEGADIKYVNDGTTPANVVGQSLASMTAFNSG